MAASAEGVFILIDRASSTLKRIQRQAEQTDRALRSTGDSLDNVGDRETVQNLEKTERELKNVSTQARKTDRDTDHLARTFRRTKRDTDGFRAGLHQLGRSLASLGQIWRTLRLPAMIVGFGTLIGVAAQGIGALAGGIVALLPRIADLAGALGAVPAAVGAIGGAMLTAKLAFGGLKEAMKGNKEALKALTPEARKFVDTLKLYKPLVEEFRRSAQRGLFPGLGLAIRELAAAAPMMNRVFEMFGRRMGRLAATAGRRFTRGGFLADFETLANQSGNVLERMGKGVLNLIDALMNVAIAARPFTNWLTGVIENWTKWIRHVTEVNRENGKLALFFQRSRRSMERFGSIIHNIWDTLRGLGRAARPLGERLWNAFERATKGWANFVGQRKNQVELTKNFLAMGGAIEEMGGLVMDLVEAIFRMGQQQTLKTIAQDLREVVPVVERILDTLVKSFGPPIVRLIVNLGKLLEHLSGQSGPLVTFLEILDKIVSGFNWLFEHVPQLGAILSAAFSVAILTKFSTALGGIATKLLGLGALAKVAGFGGGAAEGAAAGGAAAAARRPGVIAAVGSRAGPAALLAALGYFASTGFLDAQVAKGQADMAERPFGQRIALARQRLQAPVPEHVGLRGYIPGYGLYASARQTIQRRINPLTGEDLAAGVIGRSMRSQFAGGANPIERLENQIGYTRRAARRTFQLLPNDEERRRFRELWHEENQARWAVIKGLKEERTQRRIAAGQTLGRNVQRAFNIRLRAPQIEAQPEAFTSTLADAAKRLTKIPGFVGRKAAGEEILEWAKRVEQNNPKLTTAYEKARKVVKAKMESVQSSVVVVNEKIFKNTDNAWKNIHRSLTTQTEQARQDVASGFTKIQQAAMTALLQMGYAPAQAKAIIRGGGERQDKPTPGGPMGMRRAAGTTLAGGGRIVGSGLRDTVPLTAAMAAPGELVVNRHTESRVNRVLRAHGTTLDREVGKEGRPHYAPGPQSGGAVGGILPGLAKGGRVPGGSGSLPAAAMEANRIAGLGLSYVFGGGHGTPAPANGPFDCSSSVSRVLQAAGWNIPTMTSSAFLNYGSPGMGPLTIAARPGEGRAGHVYLIINGKAWGTSTSNPGGGPGWISGYTTRPGFQYRVPPGVMAGQGAKGQFAFGIPNLKIPRSGLGGVPGALANRALGIMGTGLQQSIAKNLMGMTGGAAGGGGTSGANQALAKQMMMGMGWGAGEWPSLQSLWMGESGFNASAANPSSGAFGIPQALPGSKMASAGLDWQTNPATQIRWGLNYIRGRYGSPSAAYQTWLGRSPHWYQKGGRIGQLGGAGAGQHLYRLPGKWPGLLQRGNIDLLHRPSVPFQGGHASVHSASFQDDRGREVLVPTVIPGGKRGWQVAGDTQAWDYYQRSHQQLGVFDTVPHADAYASALHLQQARLGEGKATGGRVGVPLSAPGIPTSMTMHRGGVHINAPVHVNISGTGGDPSQIGMVVQAAVEQAMHKAAREFELASEMTG